LHDAAIKWLVADIPVYEVLFFRSATVLTVCLAVGGPALLRHAATTKLKPQLLFRGLVNLAAWLCYYSAAKTLPLAQLLCLYFAAPLIVTVMARQILKENVTASRWLSVGIGFIGVLFASDPFGVSASTATVLVLIAAALWGFGAILMRQIAHHDAATMLQMLSVNAVFFICTGIICVVHWQSVTPSQLAMLFGVGLLGGIAQYLVYETIRLIQASVMATVEYSALPWAFLLGYLIWSDIPALPVFLGAGLIFLAGAILVRSERRAAIVSLNDSSA
jgi:drug/metabolite transporter (DMT)-like permease